MTRVLQAGRVEPQSGELRSIVVFLHGYGANGADLLGLADPLAEHLPDTLFVAPDVSEAIPGYPPVGISGSRSRGSTAAVRKRPSAG